MDLISHRFSTTPTTQDAIGARRCLRGIGACPAAKTYVFPNIFFSSFHR